MGKITLTQIEKWRDEAADAWKAEHATKERVQGKVLKLLEDRFEQIVMSMLGLARDSWSRDWRVDHVNGRQSDVTKFIREHAKEEATKWLAETFEKLPPLTQKEAEALKKEYLSSLFQKVREAAMDIGQEEAEAMAKEALTRVEKKEGVCGECNRPLHAKEA